MGPSGGGIGEGTGGPGETATLLEAIVIGIVCDLVVSAANVHRLETLEGLCCKIPLLSLRNDPLREGRRSNEVVSKMAFGRLLLFL